MSDPLLRADAHVLVIDSRRNALRAVRNELHARKLKVANTGDAEQAYRHAVESGPDIILLNHPPQAGDAMALLRRLKADASTADIPVLVLSQGGSVEERLEAFRSGAADYVLHPVAVEEMLARIRIHLRLAKHDRNSWLADKSAPAAVREQDEAELLVSAAQAYVRFHLADISNTRTIARRLGVSDRRLIEVFKARVNMTPFEYLRKERMQRAKILLRTTPLTLQSLAGEVGYSSAANFVTAFRGYCGIPPAQYRKENEAARKEARARPPLGA